MFASQAVQAAATGTLDPSQIMASVGEVPYAWTIESDALSWGANAASVLMVRNATAITNGRAYAKLLDPATTLTRIDAVMKSPHRDEGAGIPYQIQYPLITTGTDKKLWVEDTGRWFADGNGKPMRAQGIVRVINERHEQEEKLEFLSRFDGLTGEMNRFHLTEVLKRRATMWCALRSVRSRSQSPPAASARRGAPAPLWKSSPAPRNPGRSQGQAPGFVPGLSSERRARCAAAGQRARRRRDRRSAERAPHPARLRAGGRYADARAFVL